MTTEFASTPAAELILCNSQVGIAFDQGGIVSGLGKNKLINGNFNVNQRGVYGSVVLAAGVYGHDRWKAGAAGCSYTFATVNNVTTIIITAGSLIQVIEGLNLFSGTHTLSWAGTAQGKIGTGAYAASGVTGIAVGGDNLNVEFGVGTLSMVQMETGHYPSYFEQRLIQTEFALCQRYYEISEATFYGGSGLNYFPVQYVVAKRTAPTVVRINSGAITSSTAGTTITATSISMFYISNTYVVGGLFTSSAEL